MMSAEWIWLERWKGMSPARMMDEGEFADVLALRERWRTIEEHREVWFRSLGADDPGQIVAYQTTTGTGYEAPLWQLVQHAANHATYHRGQIVTLLRLLGAKPVGTDMVTWDRDTPKERPEPAH
jgi:uncharacterized damage-inducible protein DinB